MLRGLRLFVRVVDRISEGIGRIVMWFALVMVLLTAYNVFERYVLGRNTTYLIELNWHLYSVIFLLGAAYTLKHDGHVRVDMLYHRLSSRGKAWINLVGSLFFLLPLTGFLIWGTLWSKYGGFENSFVGRSWKVLERSPDPGGLPARYLLKTMIPVGFSLLALQGLAEAARNALFLWESHSRSPRPPKRRSPPPLPDPESTSTPPSPPSSSPTSSAASTPPTPAPSPEPPREEA